MPIKIDDFSLSVEDSISQEERLKQGIFFTKENAIDIICQKVDFTKIKSVIDTGAGSCNFLIYLAQKHKHIQFYGIEKNKEVYTKTLEIVKDYPNIKYFNGDLFFDEFDIPKCDYYIGNPPWVNFIDLDETYREKIKKIWTENFTVKKDFRMLLGDSRGDLSQLFMYYSINKFLKDGCGFSVIMPLTCIRSKNSSSDGFRDFKDLTITEISEISKINPFANTERTSCFIVGVKGGKTDFPIEYKIYNNHTDYEVRELYKKENTLVFKGDNDISGKCYYTPRQGINTLGANDIFFFKTEPNLKSDIVKRLLKSSDIKKWSYSPSYWVILPYRDNKIMKDDVFMENYPKEYEYLLSHKTKLSKRKSKLVKSIFYQLFGVGDYTFKKYKVIWKGLGSKRLECAVVGEESMPNQSMHCYISTDNQQEAHYICGVMNSNFYEEHLLKNCESGSKSFGQPNVISGIIIPQFNQENKSHIEISQLSKKFHNNGTTQKELSDLESLVQSIYQ